MKYGWQYYLEPTPKNVSRWLLALKSITAIAAGSLYVTHSPAHGFWVMMAGGVLNELGMLFSESPEQNKQ